VLQLYNISNFANQLDSFLKCYFYRDDYDYELGIIEARFSLLIMPTLTNCGFQKLIKFLNGFLVLIELVLPFHLEPPFIDYK
jgi:hypothetical protein